MWRSVSRGFQSYRSRRLLSSKPSNQIPSTKPRSETVAARSIAASSATIENAQLPKQASRIDRFILKSPKFLHKHLHSLRAAPVSHISAFLILHELTAVIPLFGLAGTFHYYQWLPPYFAEGAWVAAGVEKFGKYARRKGWISTSEEQEAERQVTSGGAPGIEHDIHGGRSHGKANNWFNRGEGGVRWVIEFATAYAIVKAFLVPRLLLSAWAAPSFARWTVIPLVNVFRGAQKKVRNPRA